MTNTDAYLEIEARMTDADRETFMERVIDACPGLQGAKVADALELYDEADALLEVREPFLQSAAGRHYANRVMVRVASIAAAVLRPADMAPLVAQLMGE